MFPALLGPGVVSTLVALAVGAGPASASSLELCDYWEDNVVQTDLYGDGLAAVAVGQPTYDGSRGVVFTYTPDGVRTTLTPASLGLTDIEPDARFGAAVAVADVTGTSCAELLVGAPGQGPNGTAYLFGAGEDGLELEHTFVMPGAGSAADFGSAVALTIAPSAVWVGVPGHDVGSAVDAGAIVRYSLTSGTASAPRVITQSSSGVPGTSESGDRFGERLGSGFVGDGSPAYVVTGTPSEDVGPLSDAGSVTALTVSIGGVLSARSVTQDSAGIPGTAEAGDRFGAALSTRRSRVAVGVPGENIGSIVDAGLVQRLVIDGDDASMTSFGPTLHQGSPGVSGTNEAGDRWGSAVSVSKGSVCGAVVSLNVGAPGEDVGPVGNAGTVVQIPFAGPTPSCPAWLLARGGILGGAPALNDAVGATVATASTPIFDAQSPDDYFDYVVVGAPGLDSVGATNTGGVTLVSRYTIVEFDHPDLNDGRFGTVLADRGAVS